MKLGLNRRLLLASGLLLAGPLVFFQLPIDYRAVFFEGGLEATLLSLSQGVVIAFLPLFLISVGGPIVGGSKAGDLDVFVVLLMVGVGAVLLAGTILGFLGLLRPIVTAPLFLAGVWLAIRQGTLTALRTWLTASDLAREPASEGLWPIRPVACAARWVLLLGASCVVIWKGLPINIDSGDSLQLYVGYYADVVRTASTWLVPGDARYADYFTGRGNGLFLFMTSFTTPLLAQPLSMVLVGFTAILFGRLVRLLASVCTVFRNPLSVSTVLGDLFAAAALFIGLADVDPGKYHSLYACFMLFLAYLAARVVVEGPPLSRSFKRALLVSAIAVPILFAPLVTFLSLPLSVSLLCVLARRGRNGSGDLVFPFVCGMAAVAALLTSLAIDRAVVGIPGFYPWEFWLPYADLGRVSELFSPLLIEYINLIQRIDSISGLDPWTLPSRLAGLFARQPISLLHPSLWLAGGIMLAGIGAGLARVLGGRVASWRLDLMAASGQSQWPTLSIFAVVAASYGLPLFVLALTNQISLHRMMYFLGLLSLLPAFGLAILFAGWLDRLASLTIRYRSHNTANRERVVDWTRFASLSVIVLAVADLAVATRPSLGLGLEGSWRRLGYLAGLNGAAVTMTHRLWVPERCREIDAQVPPGARVLPINANMTTVPCLGALFLPSNRFVHHYQSVLAPHFVEIVFGPPEQAVKLLQQAGVDYFYYEKGNHEFFAWGLSRLFESKWLTGMFDLLYENDDYALLTWKGRGNGPIPEDLARQMAEARAVTAARPERFYYWEGLERLWPKVRRDCADPCRLEMPTAGKPRSG
jgi:hypothetical protein